METAFVGGVGGEGAAFGVLEAGVLQVGVEAFAVVVGIDEFLAGVIGRVDVNHLDLAVVAFLQQLEHFEVIAFNKQIFGAVEIHRLVAARFESGVAGLLDQTQAVALAGPVHAVALTAVVVDVAELTQLGLEPLEVDTLDQLTGSVAGFAEDAGKELLELFFALFADVQ